MTDTPAAARPARNSDHLNVTVTADTRHRLEAAARAEDRTLAHIVRRAIDRELARLDAQADR